MDDKLFLSVVCINLSEFMNLTSQIVYSSSLHHHLVTNLVFNSSLVHLIHKNQVQ